MRLILQVCLLALGVLHLSLPYAAAGDADPAFGSGAGYVTYATPYAAPWLITGGFVLADGSAILAGHAESQVYVRHYYRDGTLDTGFGFSGTAALGEFFPFALTGIQTFGPTVQVYPVANDTILVEQSGLIRRFSATGQYDPAYRPQQLDLDGLSPRPTVLPQPDGRFIVVTGAKSGTDTAKPIAVRYYLPNGAPDTVRGDAHGERLVYSSGSGAYTPTGAAMQTDGKLLIAATRFRPSYDRDLVLIRLNPDGSYDNGFGPDGMVTLAANVGFVGIPAVAVGSNGQIAYLFSVPISPMSYFVVYLLRADGTLDTAAPGGGRISVAISDPAIYFTGSISFASPPPKLAVHMPGLLWQYDLTLGGPIPPPRYAHGGQATGFAELGFAFGGETLWSFGGEDSFPFTALGYFGPYTFGRGVAVPHDAASFGAGTPPRISASFPALPSAETIEDLQWQSDGGLLSLGRSTKYRTSFVLTKYESNGLIDREYGAGAGRVILPIQSNPSCLPMMHLLKASDGSATLSTSNTDCEISGLGRASLLRFLPSGAADLELGGSGVVALPPIGFNLDSGAGFVDSSGQTTILILDLDPLSRRPDFPARPYPIRLGRDGKAVAGFNGSAHGAFPVDTTLPARTRLDRLPDGRMQAIIVAGGHERIGVTTLRWLPDGAVDPSSPIPATVQLSTANASSYALDLDTTVMPDGSTIVAIWEPGQRILLRLHPSGKQDPAFGVAGTARIDGVVPFPASRPRVRLAAQPDGRILLAYTVQSNGGKAIAVARFLADGRPDTTFAAGGRFDSVFSVTSMDIASDIVRLPDGKLMVAGASGGRALLLRLKGEGAAAVEAQGALEFFNAALGHYFITANTGEASGIDLGNAGAGWQATGLGFPVWTAAGGLPAGSLPVCRFYGTPERGPNSHFYTVSASECAAVKSDPGWTYEGIAFHAYAPVNDRCSGTQQPVYRAYNNRFAQNDSNHRYASDPATLQPLAAQGWTLEGAVFCVPAN